MATPLSTVDDAMTDFVFQGCDYPVMHAYTSNGQPTWLDAKGELIEGIYIGMENEVYHALPAYSSSQLKTFIKKSPAHFYRKYVSDIDRKRTMTNTLQRTLDAGTYGHELILEPHGFYDRYYRDIVPSDYPNALRTIADLQKEAERLAITGIPKSAAKQRYIDEIIKVNPTVQIWDQIVADHSAKPHHRGKIAIDAIVWDDAHRVVDTARAHEDMDILIQDGLPEISFIAKCPETGLWLKCRFDWLRFDCIAVDVKTTASTDPDAFARQAGNLGYHIQEAFYTYVSSLLNVNLQMFIFACIEYVEADIAEIYNLDHKDEAMTKFKVGLHQLAECLDTDVWTARTESLGINTISIPAYCR